VWYDDRLFSSAAASVEHDGETVFFCSTGYREPSFQTRTITYQPK